MLAARVVVRSGASRKCHISFPKASSWFCISLGKSHPLSTTVPISSGGSLHMSSMKKTQQMVDRKSGQPNTSADGGIGSTASNLSGFRSTDIAFLSRDITHLALLCSSSGLPVFVKIVKLVHDEHPKRDEFWHLFNDEEIAAFLDVRGG